MSVIPGRGRISASRPVFRPSTFQPLGVNPPPPKKKRRTGLIIGIIIGIIILIIIIVIVVILLMRRNSDTGTTGCTSDANCSGATPKCNTITGICRGCLNSGDCSGTTPLCNTTSGTCVECISDTNCEVNETCESGICEPVSCNNDIDCEGSFVCDTGENICVECLVDGDCSGITPLCNATTNVCVECIGDVDCINNETCVNDTCQCLPPNIITDLVLSSPAAGQIDGIFTAETDVSYEVEIIEVGSGDLITNVFISPNIGNFTYSTLNGGNWHARIRGTNTCGSTSLYSNFVTPVCVGHMPPTIITTIITGGLPFTPFQLILGNGVGASTYDVQIWTDPFMTATMVASATGLPIVSGSVTATFTNQVFPGSYYIFVRGTGPCTPSQWSGGSLINVP